MMKAAIALLFLSAGCTAPLERPAQTPQAAQAFDCAGLDRDHRTWGATAKFSGVLSGSGALATLPMSDDQKTLRFSVGLIAAGLGALAAAAVYVEQDAAATWAKKCSQ